MSKPYVMEFTYCDKTLTKHCWVDKSEGVSKFYISAGRIPTPIPKAIKIIVSPEILPGHGILDREYTHDAKKNRLQRSLEKYPNTPIQFGMIASKGVRANHLLRSIALVNVLMLIKAHCT